MSTIDSGRSAVRLFVLVPLIGLSACGDDSDASATTSATPGPEIQEAEPAAFTPDPAVADFCEIARELIEQDGFPTAEQLATYQELAPDEIAEPAAVAAAAIEAADGDFANVFADDAAATAIGALETFEAEACGLGEPSDPSVTQLDPDATRIDVTAADYHFDLEAPTSAGRYSFVMTNTGAEVHLMALVHLEDGATAEQVIESEGEVGMIESFESDIAPPGSTAVVTADLTPGRWVLVCPVPNEEGTQHHLLGMVHEFEIT